MAVTATITKTDFGGYSIVNDADSDASIALDVMSGPCRLMHIHVDNNANSADSFLKLYDNVNPTVGTTVPDYVFKAQQTAANAEDRLEIPCNVGTGFKFTNGLSFACVTVGGTAGVTGPTSSVIVTLTLLPGVS